MSVLAGGPDGAAGLLEQALSNPAAAMTQKSERTATDLGVSRRRAGMRRWLIEGIAYRSWGARTRCRP